MRNKKHLHNILPGWILALGLIFCLIAAGALAGDELPEMTYQLVPADGSVTRGDLVILTIPEQDGVVSCMIGLGTPANPFLEGRSANALPAVIELPTAGLQGGEYTLTVSGYSETNWFSTDTLVSESTETITVTEPEVQGHRIFGCIGRNNGADSFTYREGLSVSFYAPGAIKMTLTVSDGTDYGSNFTDSISTRVVFRADGEYTLFAEAFYEDGSSVKTDVYTVTQRAAGSGTQEPSGAITGITVDMPAFLPDGEDLEATVDRHGLDMELNWHVVVYDLNEDKEQIIYMDMEPEDDSFYVSADEFVSGHRYYFSCVFEDPDFDYDPQVISTVLQVGEVSEDVTLEVNGETEFLSASAGEEAEISISAPDATAVSIVIGDNDMSLHDMDPDAWYDDGGWSEHPEDISFSLNFNDRYQIFPVVSWACFDEDPFAEDAVWVMSNVITVTLESPVESPDGEIPAVEVDDPDTAVIQGHTALFPLANKPDSEDYEGCFWSIEGVDGTEGFLEGNTWYDVVRIRTDSLTPGRYRITLKYQVAGETGEPSVFFLDVTELPEMDYQLAPAGGSVSRGDLITVTVPAQDDVVSCMIVIGTPDNPYYSSASAHSLPAVIEIPTAGISAYLRIPSASASASGRTGNTRSLPKRSTRTAPPSDRMFTPSRSGPPAPSPALRSTCPRFSPPGRIWKRPSTCTDWIWSRTGV